MNKKSDSHNLSNIIRSMREEKQYSQGFMAKKLKVTQQAYSNMEKNPEGVTLKRLREIAELLGVELITLLGIDSALVQQNFGQKGGNAATQMVNHYTTQEHNDLYERMIGELKEEITCLRALVVKK
jgi:transcriptional regulator with XRE-family HTH domain